MAFEFHDPLSALTSARWALEGKSDFWALVLQVSTVAVGIGVLVEVVATAVEIAEDRREGKKLPFHAIMTLFGGALVAIALVFEFFAEFQSASTETALRANNAAAQGELDRRAREATAQAVAIAGRFGGLQKFVAQKEGEMDSTFSDFKTFETRQRKRTDAAITAITGKEDKLQTALDSVDASARKAAGASDVATKVSTSMTETLNSERQMSAQMRAIITHRVMSDAQSADLVQKLKPFANTPFDMQVSDDPDARQIMFQIVSALESAGWTWKPSPSIGALVLNMKGKPQVSLITTVGIHVEIAQSSKADLEKPVLALVNGLILEGIPMLQPTALPDDQMDKAFDKKVVHIAVGVRD